MLNMKSINITNNTMNIIPTQASGVYIYHKVFKWWKCDAISHAFLLKYSPIQKTEATLSELFWHVLISSSSITLTLTPGLRLEVPKFGYTALISMIRLSI